MARVRFALILVFAGALFTLPAWAMEPRLDRDTPSPLAYAAPNALTRLWSLLIEIWQGNGCIIDPYGGCSTGQGTSNTDNGCILDPHGACSTAQSTSATDNGCGIDPYGGCTPGN